MPVKILFCFLFFLNLLSGADRPNIILFVTDDQSPIAGCYGNRVIQTPHLDALRFHYLHPRLCHHRFLFGIAIGDPHRAP